MIQSSNNQIFRCCAVVVSYNPTEQIIKAVESLAAQISDVIIIDNASKVDSMPILQILETIHNVKVQYNKTNLGIATALNQGIKYANQQNYKWFATFDQDSLTSPDYFKTMMDAYNDYDKKDLVAIVAPRYATKTGLLSFSESTDSKDEISNTHNIVKTTITSGNLIKLSIFEKTGNFDESLFIDYVDHEFCLRLKHHGFQILESCHSFLQHELGESVCYNFMGVDIVTTNHSHIRRYYKYRNMVAVLRKHAKSEPSIMYPMIRALFLEPLKIISLEKNKVKKIQYILKGLLHGIMNISGELRE
jgi:rhamnosyltransferase